LKRITTSSAARRPRLGIDFHTFDGIYQGSRSHILGLYSEAILQAPDIDFIFFLTHPEMLRTAHPEFARDNVQLVAVPHRPAVLRLLWQLTALQRRYRLDLFHLQYRLPLFPSGPCICTVHDVLFETHPKYFGRNFVRMARWSARRAVRNSRIVLTVSEYSRKQIARHYGIDANEVALTPNAVDQLRFHPGSEGEATLRQWGLRSGEYICTLGRLEPRKNHLTLVEAYFRLGENAPVLLIIGQRDFAYSDVFKLIRRYGLESRVRILEDVDDEALPVLLRHARLMAYPSQAEGFGMPVLEALASGIPVITSNVTSLPEVAGSAAWLISPENIGQLAEALRQALSETPEARQARIDRGLRHARQFSWKYSAASFLAAVRLYFLNKACFSDEM
jgi:glycosyltransferase involved in cell wall biosynthesis